MDASSAATTEIAVKNTPTLKFYRAATKSLLVYEAQRTLVM